MKKAEIGQKVLIPVKIEWAGGSNLAFLERTVSGIINDGEYFKTEQDKDEVYQSSHCVEVLK